MNAFFLAAKPRLNADLTVPIARGRFVCYSEVVMQEIVTIELDNSLWYFELDLLWDVGYLCALRSCDPNRKVEAMKHKVFTVYDSKAEVYMQPIFFRAVGEAMRAFRVSIAQSGHRFADNPGDYTLFCIGEYDDDNGRVLMYDAFENLGNGAQFSSGNETWKDLCDGGAS